MKRISIGHYFAICYRKKNTTLKLSTTANSTGVDSSFIILSENQMFSSADSLKSGDWFFLQTTDSANFKAIFVLFQFFLD